MLYYALYNFRAPQMQKMEASVVTWPCTTFIINKRNCWPVCQTSIKKMQNWHSGTLPISKTCSWICLERNFTSNCCGETMEFRIIQVILTNDTPNFPKYCRLWPVYAPGSNDVMSACYELILFTYLVIRICTLFCQI